MEFNLIPLPYRKYIHSLKTTGTIGVFVSIVLLFFMVFADCFQDVFTPIFLMVLLLAISSTLLIPGIVYEKISHSTVAFGSDKIRINSKTGLCWREIPYYSITKVCVREITGFFYGEIKHQLKHSYICLFLNGQADIPELSYSKMFLTENFFMISFQPDALHSLQYNMSLFNSSDSFYNPDG